MIPTVFKFNKEVVGIDPRPLAPMSPSEKLWMHKVLVEEANELVDSTNVVDQVDALIDSVVFALGGLYRLGLTPEEASACFHAVMDANFAKKRGVVGRRAVDGVADAVKPDGWVSPETRIAAILKKP